MDEYIKLKNALHILDLVMSDENIKHKGKAIRKRLKELPPADVVDVKHGEWIKATPCSQEYCNQCGLTPKTIFGILPNYCPNCGAKMDKKVGAEG